jgi:transcriptional regulator with XRE-family HTH domain
MRVEVRYTCQVTREGRDTGAAEVGQAIRRARQAAGLSMVELAARTGVSQPFLSQVERGVHSPSLSTLYRLAEGLGTIPGAFLVPGSGDGLLTHSAGQRIPVTETDHPQMAHVLIPGGRSDLLEAYEHELDPHSDDEGWFEHDGEDFVYVLAGRLVVELGNGESCPLGPGESAHYPGTVPHRWRLLDEQSARLLLLVARPH